MTQYLRPDSNITQTNFTNGFAEIDEVTASDADYAYSADGVAGTLEVGLSNPSPTPDTARTITVRIRCAKVSSGSPSSGGPDSTFTCYVYEGATLRATSSVYTLNSGSWSTRLFLPDLSAVVDWTLLSLRFVTSAVATGVGISWVEMELDPPTVWDKTISESSTPGDSLTTTATFVASFSETAAGGDTYVTASNANIHAFTRLPFGEIWFMIPSGTSASHNYYSFCVDESQRANAPVWFKGAMNASAVIDDPQLGADAPYACLRIADSASADLYSFDRRADGTIDVDWNLTSSAFYLDEAERRVLIKRYYRDFESQDNDVTLQLLTYDFPAGNNVASPSLTVANTEPTKDFRISGRLLRMKFSGTGRCRLGKPAFDIVRLGER